MSRSATAIRRGGRHGSRCTAARRPAVVLGDTIRMAFHAIVDVGNLQISAVLRLAARRDTSTHAVVAGLVLLREMARVIEARLRQIVAHQTNRIHLKAAVDVVVSCVSSTTWQVMQPRRVN